MSDAELARALAMSLAEASSSGETVQCINPMCQHHFTATQDRGGTVRCPRCRFVFGRPHGQPLPGGGSGWSPPSSAAAAAAPPAHAPTAATSAPGADALYAARLQRQFDAETRQGQGQGQAQAQGGPHHAAEPTPTPTPRSESASDAALATRLQHEFDAEERRIRAESDAQSHAAAVRLQERQRADDDAARSKKASQEAHSARIAADEAESLRLARELYAEELTHAGLGRDPHHHHQYPGGGRSSTDHLNGGAAAAMDVEARPSAGGSAAAHGHRVKRIKSVPLATQLRDEEIRAKAVLDEILASSMQSNTQFVDSDFPPALKSLYFNGRSHADGAEHRHRSTVAHWTDPVRDRSLSRHYLARGERWTVFNGPRPEDVSQGGLGNCWFMAALAAVVERPHLVKKLFVTDEINEAGVYCVKLCKDGVWQHVLLDGLFPVNSGRALAYAQPARGQMWVMLLEKAFSKLYGCFEAVDGGTGDEALRVLTGQPVETVQVEQNPNSKALIDHDVAWVKLLSFKEAGFIMCASCGLAYPSAVSNADYDRIGLVSNHAYTIINVVEHSGHRLLQMRNPWASDRVDWRGEWSDRWPGWSQYPALKAELCPMRDSEGVFWMSFHDFCQFFSAAWVCKERPDWLTTAQKAEMPPPQSTMWSGWEVTPFKNTQLEVELYQRGRRDARQSSGTAFDMGCLLLSLPQDSQDDWCSANVTIEAAAPRKVQDTVGFEAMLRENRRHLVVPISFNRGGADGTPLRYIATFHSNEPVLIDRRPEISSEVVARGMYLRARAEGQRNCPFAGITQYTLNDCGMIIIMENRSRGALTAKVSYEGHNVVASRGSMSTEDTVPANSFQVLNVMSQAIDGAGWQLGGQTSFTMGGWTPWADARGSHRPDLVSGSVHNSVGFG